MRCRYLAQMLALLLLTTAAVHAQTGWDPDRLTGFGANITGGGSSLNYGWTTGNLGDTWQEGEWVPYQLELKNVDLSNPNFTDIVINWDFTKGNQNARYIDLVRGIQVGTIARNDTQGWPFLNGTAMPHANLVNLNIAQNGQGITGGVEHVWSGFYKLTLPNNQVNFGPGLVTDALHSIRITKTDIINAFGGNMPSPAPTTLVLYFNLHLAQSFIWQYSLQSQFNAPPTNNWGGYLYANAPYSTDSRFGSGYVSGSSGHVTVNFGSRTVPLPVPPAPLGSISGLKWHDINMNGVKDPSESVLQGWDIYASTLVGGIPISLTATTDVNGAYSFSPLPSAVYVISEKSQGLPVPSGAQNLPPNNTSSTWAQSYPDAFTSPVGVATSIATPGGVGYAGRSWEVDLMNTASQGDVNFGNGIPKPECAVTPSSLDLCDGETAVFTVYRDAQGTSPFTYKWYDASDNIVASTAILTLTTGTSTAGTYHAIITDANGLTSDPCYVTLTRKPLPDVSVNSETLCFGTGDPSLNASVNPTNPNVTFTWSPGTYLSATTGASVVFTPPNPGTFTVDVTAYDPATQCSKTVTSTITVNPIPTVNTVPNQVFCAGEATTAVSFSGAVQSTVYSWTNSNPAIGLASSGTGDIASFTAENTGLTAISATITVTPSYTAGGVTCTGTPTSFTITVNPRPVVDQVTSQVRCNGASTAAVNFTGAPSGAVFDWTNDQPGIGLAGSGTGNIASFAAINTGTAPIVATITVTPSYTNLGVTCTGDPMTFTITVNPTPTVDVLSDKVYCNAELTTLIPVSGSVPGTTFSWTNSNTAIGLAANGSGNIPAFNATNTGTSPISATITVTPSYSNGGQTCTGTPRTFTITVNPTPDVDPITSQVHCNGDQTYTVMFSGNVNNTEFEWTSNNTSIGIAASGTGDIAGFTAINTSTTPVVATITVTPTYTNLGKTCSGTPETFTITVNPTPTATQVANQVRCNGTQTAAITFTGAVPGTVYDWVNTDPTIGLAASGTGDIAAFTAVNTGNAPVTAIITVTPKYSFGGVTCTGTIMSFAITVNPTPTVDPIADQVLCNGESTTAITFTGYVPGTVYSWTNSASGIGLAANGTGNIGSFVATNTTNAPIVATITVTPSFENGGLTCTGTPETFTITVNPTPTVNTVANQVRCNGESTTAITFSGFVPGTVYSWTNTNTAIGLAATGTGNIGAFNAINTTNAPIVATITVTPSYTNAGKTCTGTPTSFTITVNPTPTVNQVADQVRCNGTQTAAVTFSGFVPNTVYSWTNTTTAIGLAASGVGDIPAFTATNSTNAPIVATITVTPSYTNAGKTCTGTPTTFTITVNPTPTVNQVADQVRCNGTSTAAITFTGFVPGTVYNWVNTTPSIGLAASGTGNIGAFTATNTTNAPVVATITVTPSFTNAGLTCTGTPISFTITVNPTPTVDQVASQVRCNGTQTAAVTFTGFVPGTVYNWVNTTPSIGLAASGTGNIGAFTATNTTNAPIVATITVTPSFTNAGLTCTGTPISFTITVNPTPTVNQVADQARCNGTQTAAVTFSGFVPGTVYNWVNTTPSIGLAASGIGNIGAFTATNTTNAPIVATITVTPSFTNAGLTCTGTPISFTITVNPTPTVNQVADQVRCNGTQTAAVIFSGFVPGTVYNWVNTTPSIGLAASGIGNIGAFTATNTTNAPIVATITVTPSFTNAGLTCSGTPISFTITVNPTPTVNQVADQVRCNGTQTAAVTFSGFVPGTVYNWVNTTPSIGLAASGNGNIGAFTATNTTNAPIVATITVTPSFTNAGLTCSGTPISFTITVNPTPTVNQVADQVRCNGTSTDAITFTGFVPGTEYSWTNSAPSIGLAASGTGNIGAFTAINNGSSPVVATITVTPSYENAGTTCTGTPISFTITVNPTPACSITQSGPLCPGAQVVLSGPAGMAKYEWIVTGNGSISGANDQQQVTIIAGNVCGQSMLVTLNIEDNNTCTNTCTQSILVEDDIDPIVVKGSIDACYPTLQDAEAAAVAATSASDNCVTNLVLVPSSNGTTCDVVITVTAEDNCGNTAFVTYNTRIDGTAPTFTFVPADEEIECSQTPQFGTPVATDACGAATVYPVGDPVRDDGNCPGEYTLTQSWYAVDACGNQSQPVDQTISVVDNTAPIMVPMDPKMIACGGTLTWDTPTEEPDACGGQFQVVNTTIDVFPNVPLPGQKTHRKTWFVTDGCGNDSQVSQDIVEERCQYFTLTQGAYGNANGTWCGPGQPRRLELIQSLLSAPNPSSLVLGLPGKSFTITYNDAACVIQRMPGGGPAQPLPNGNTVFGSNCSTGSIPLQNGRFKNNLLAQTLTLGLNLRLDPGLGTLVKLPAPATPWLVTQGADRVNGICGDGDDVPFGPFLYKLIPVSVLNKLGSNGTNKTVADLYALANQALGGVNVSPTSLGDIVAALGAINDGFDEGRFFSGYVPAPPPPKASDDVSVADDFVLAANHPNPFNPTTTITYAVPEPSSVTMTVYNELGAVVDVIVNDYKSAGSYMVTWNATSATGETLPSGVYIYELRASTAEGRQVKLTRRMLLMK
jgi:hypothetical protein